MGKPKKIDAVTSELAQAFVDSARNQFEDEGRLEIDHSGDPISQLTDEEISAIKERGGCYVKAWVYVDATSLPDAIRLKYGIGEQD
jgi:hypothetical protein